MKRSLTECSAAADSGTSMTFGDARELLREMKLNSVALVVTSPPYPMIRMWDDLFHMMDNSIALSDDMSSPIEMFEKMHVQLDIVWRDLFRLLIPGGIAAINVGDATRSFNGVFQLFPNAARVTTAMLKAGFLALPNIYWKKQTNKPNSFLGSGMLPTNGYVTVDCEHILLFRKGSLRKFLPKDPIRVSSSFSQEERNKWFTQIWEGIPGVRQAAASSAPDQKKRTGAFPAEIPSRLIRMFSVRGDTVLDPFAGTGTTVTVARDLGRVGIGFEIQKLIQVNFFFKVKIEHRAFVRAANTGPFSRDYGFPFFLRYSVCHAAPQSAT